jgi:threonyl-tRNA synthetase
VPFTEAEDEAAFYGPKIDVQIWSAIGREFTLATNQLDFAVPARFGLKYTDKDGTEKTPLCIHRAPLSTHERLIGFLIEHYAGAFPVWLAPEQARIVPVATDFVERAQPLLAELVAAGMRATLDTSHDTLGKKVRNAEKMKLPYILVVGEKELADGTVTVRRRGRAEQETISVADFIARVRAESAV